MNSALRWFVLVFLICIVACLRTSAQSAKQAPEAKSKRVPWTNSQVVGSPEPPPPFRAVAAFPKLKFKDPLHLEAMPENNRLVILEQQGKIYSFENRPDIEKADLMLDCSQDLSTWQPSATEAFDALYGLTFDPKFNENRYVYICYVIRQKNGKPLANGSRVSRFVVNKENPPKIDPKSEKIILTFLGGGHNGGCLVFGPKDGYLYISTGDAESPNPPDPLNTGQDLSDLLSSVLRIDVHNPPAGKAYGIPADNPFLNVPNARPEIWAYGFRNPWKMAFDREGGDLWLGDVGWEKWEMIHRVRKGYNGGWPIMEGPQPIKPEGKLGPTPITPAAVAFPHTEAASITGGFVYRGKKLKGLHGQYLCGDWMSRKFWSISFSGDKTEKPVEIAQCPHKIVAFCEDHQHELLYVDYSPEGGIYTLEENPERNRPQPKFPTRLSETGIWKNVAQLQPAAGVEPYTIQAEPWADHAQAQRVLALPNQTQVRLFREPERVPNTAWFTSHVFLPQGGVIAKTLSLQTNRADPLSWRKIETQMTYFDGQETQFYTYRWNDEQTDAILVPAAGQDMTLEIRDPSAPSGIRKQRWHFASRGECRTCHNPWAGEVLGLTEPQLTSREGSTQSELNRLMEKGLITWGKDPTTTKRPPPKSLVNPHATEAPTEDRARSYLHVNCAHCHQNGAGGSVTMELKYDLSLEQLKLLDVRPAQGLFDIPEGKIVAPRDPYRSILYFRMAKQGAGRMPHLGSELVDTQGLKVIRDWILTLPIRKDEHALIRLCENEHSDKIKRAEAIRQLLASPTGALQLVEGIDNQRISPKVRGEILQATAMASPTVRDLFDRYIPDSEKQDRLGSTFDMEKFLDMKGDAQKGKIVFERASVQCVQCHRVGGQGAPVEIGPDLAGIGKKFSRRQILEAILDPSKDVDPKYQTYIAETEEGKTWVGLLVKKNENEVILREANGKEIKLATSKIIRLDASKKSLMPEQLLRDLSQQDARNLLAYLESLTTEKK
ncbi:MAG: PQQ-dependent sugar dehydrogenase [Gemmataceae bacterium]|nr:PQQ-dependent sugar dehydrogenase [Gemmataceae bacterium]